MGKFKNVEEFAAARTKFFESHPDAPVAEDIECLNLVMKREYAEQILAGTKKLEFRDYKPFYVKKLIDPEVSDYIRNLRRNQFRFDNFNHAESLLLSRITTIRQLVGGKRCSSLLGVQFDDGLFHYRNINFLTSRETVNFCT